MKTSRFLGLALLLAVLFADASRVIAGPAAGAPPVMFRTLAVNRIVSGLFYDDAQGRPAAVLAATGALSAPYVAPADGRVAFYRLEPPMEPETAPRRVPVAEARLDEGGPWLVIMATVPGGDGVASRPDIRLMKIDHSWAAHPPATMRVFNFSRRPAMIKIGAESGEVAPGESRLFPYASAEGETWVKVAMREETGWALRASGPQAALPGTRSTLVLVDTPPSAEDPNPRTLMISNLVDVAPRPPVRLARAD